MEASLFRQQAMDWQQEKLWGRLVISQPLSITVLAWFLTTVTLLALICLATTSYTRKATVEGHLVPDRGVIGVTSPGAGTLARIYVLPDVLVAAGDPLFELVFDHPLSTDRAYSRVMLAELDAGTRHLQQQLALEEQKQADLTGRFREQQSLQSAVIVHLQDMMKQEQKLADLRNLALERVSGLLARGLLAQADADAVQVQALEQQQACRQLELQLMERQQNLRSLEADYQSALVNSRQHTEQLGQELGELQQRKIQMAAETSTLVTAPVAARVSNVLLHAGMTAGPQEQVLSLLPVDSHLQAELMIPSSAIGFVSNNQAVSIRYDAFPYQKFGVQPGVVSSVAHNAEHVRQGEGSSQSYFRVVAELEKQSISAYGAEQPLRAGMLLTADITLDKRSLLEWLLEPLFSIRSGL